MDQAGRIHDLKILPHYFEAVKRGDKRFELRENDRDYKEGDVLRLREWSEFIGYSGREITVQVTYMLRGPGFGLREDYCILSLGPEIEVTGVKDNG